MNQLDLVQTISHIINRVLADKGEVEHPVGANTMILGGDLDFDSLDLAALVVELDQATGANPFGAGFINFYTVGELATIYSESLA